MKAIPVEERRRLGALLESRSQDQVMGDIAQFAQTELFRFAPPADGPAGPVRALVFNMERGVHLAEIGEFLERCPEARPFDVILANELDDGCVRSGGVHTAAALAERLGMDCAFGLEFIELVNEADPKGYHGNAVFSRWPIRDARVVRLPERYNWYFDRQRRIGGRLAVLAVLDMGGMSLGVGSIHLENRTDGAGREAQLRAVLDAAEEMFGDMPAVLGGDLNTNTFDGRDKDAIQSIAADRLLQRRCLEQVKEYEPCLPLAERYGWRIVPEGLNGPLPTRRKPLPGGGHLDLRLDWLLVRGMEPAACRNISTCREEWPFAALGSALAAFGGRELSDHNALWAECERHG